MNRRHDPAPTGAAGGSGLAVPGPDREDGAGRAPGGRGRALVQSLADVAGGDVRAGLVFLLGLTALGPLLGLLWAALSPRLDVATGISGSETAFTAQADIDATFGLIGLVAGVVVGVIARWRSADGGWPVPLGLAGGGFAGSLLAGWTGHLVRSPGALRQLPAHTSAYVTGLVDVKVRATGLYFVLPGTALLVLALALWLPTVVRRPGRPEPEPDDPFAAASAFRPEAVPPSEPGPREQGLPERRPSERGRSAPDSSGPGRPEHPQPLPRGPADDNGGPPGDGGFVDAGC